MIIGNHNAMHSDQIKTTILFCCLIRSLNIKIDEESNYLTKHFLGRGYSLINYLNHILRWYGMNSNLKSSSWTRRAFRPVFFFFSMTAHVLI